LGIRVHENFTRHRLLVRRIKVESGFERAARDQAMLIKSVEQAKRWLKIVFGFTLLALGVVLIFSPAPGLLVMLLGLGILAAEFVWARRLLNHLKEQSEKLRQTVFPRVDKAA
jgi:uncharacterized protein (TIGR02611 family)